MRAEPVLSGRRPRAAGALCALALAAVAQTSFEQARLDRREPDLGVPVALLVLAGVLAAIERIQYPEAVCLAVFELERTASGKASG